MQHIREKGLPPHLDSENSAVSIAEHGLDLLEKEDKPIVSANAYLGAREIVKGLEEGADIIIAGRVADASPVRSPFLKMVHATLGRQLTNKFLGHWCSMVLALLDVFVLRRARRRPDSRSLDRM